MAQHTISCRFSAMVFIFSCCVSLAVGGNSLREAEKLSEEILNQLLKENSYNALIRPAVTTRVSINTHIRNIDYLNDLDMEMSARLIIRLTWVDERLNYENFTTKLNKSLIPDYITIGDASQIWYPDIFVSNEKTGSIHNILKPNVLIRIHRNGSMLFSTRMTLVLDCKMRLNWYPFDKHRCPMIFGSYALTKNELPTVWAESVPPVSVPSEGLYLAKFTFVRVELESKGGTGDEYEQSILHFIFEREFSYYLVNIFLPSCMMVFISWISFWFDVTAIEARVTLGVTTILTMTTQTFGFNQSAPVVSYTKAIDVFSGTCLTFIAMALLEFAFVDNTLRRYSASTGKVFPKPDLMFSEGNLPKVLINENITESKFRAMRIDKIARVAFPVTFFGFLAVFFGICFSH